MNAAPLFRPFTAGSLTMKNRIVMAPMTRSFSPHGIPTDDVTAYYKRRADGGVGLIVTEGTAIDRPGAKNDPNVPDFHGPSLLAWQRIVDTVHAAGGRIAPQLWHVGARVSRRGGFPTELLESPSGIDMHGNPLGHAMSEADIQATIDAYARGAADARWLGFDAVELHGAHGYLIDQFFWEQTNRRTDRWGGATIRERSRFAVEVIKATRAALGSEIPLILRFSQWKIEAYDARIAHSPDDLRTWLEPLAEAGVDIFHCSQRRYSETEFAGSNDNLAGWTKKITGKPTITVGSIGLTSEFTGPQRDLPSEAAPIDELLERLGRDEFDLVAIGRPLLADPEWVAKIRAGRIGDIRIFTEADRLTLH